MVWIKMLLYKSKISCILQSKITQFISFLKILLKSRKMCFSSLMEEEISAIFTNMKILYAFLNLQFYFYFIRYLKEYDYYERCVRERQWQEKPPKVFKRHRNNSSSSGCLCFTGRSRSNDSKRAYRTVWISKVNFHSLKQFACYTTLSTSISTGLGGHFLSLVHCTFYLDSDVFCNNALFKDWHYLVVSVFQMNMLFWNFCLSVDCLWALGFQNILVQLFIWASIFINEILIIDQMFFIIFGSYYLHFYFFSTKYSTLLM